MGQRPKQQTAARIWILLGRSFPSPPLSSSFPPSPLLPLCVLTHRQGHGGPEWAEAEPISLSRLPRSQDSPQPSRDPCTAAGTLSWGPSALLGGQLLRPPGPSPHSPSPGPTKGYGAWHGLSCPLQPHAQLCAKDKAVSNNADPPW